MPEQKDSNKGKPGSSPAFLICPPTVSIDCLGEKPASIARYRFVHRDNDLWVSTLGRCCICRRPKQQSVVRRYRLNTRCGEPTLIHLGPYPRCFPARYSSRMAARTFARTSSGISFMLCIVSACSAAFFKISSSVSPRATKSQSMPTSLHRSTFAISHLLSSSAKDSDKVNSNIKISGFPVIALHSHWRGERTGEPFSMPPLSHQGRYFGHQA